MDTLVSGFTNPDRAYEVNRALINWTKKMFFSVEVDKFGTLFIAYPEGKLTNMERRVAVAFVQGLCYND